MVNGPVCAGDSIIFGALIVHVCMSWGRIVLNLLLAQTVECCWHFHCFDYPILFSPDSSSLYFRDPILQATFRWLCVRMHAKGNEALPPRFVLLDLCCLFSLLLRLNGVPRIGECSEFRASWLLSSLFVACLLSF